MTKSSLHLPKEICFLVRDYLSNLDYNCFMNTSKRLYGETKKETVYITLFVPDVWNFFLDQSFREFTLSKIMNPFHQLRLNFTSAEYNEPLPTFIKSISYPILDFYEILTDKASTFMKLGLKFGKVQSFSAFYVLERLELDAKFVTTKLAISIQQHPLVLTNLHHLREVNLYYLKDAVDLIPLRNLHKLVISKCLCITDVSCLWNIYDLTLIECNNIEDITALSTVKKIVILNCEKIKNYNPVANAKSISLGIQHQYKINLIKFSFIHELQVANNLMSCSINYARINRLILKYASHMEPVNFGCFSEIPYVKIDFIGSASIKPSISGLGKRNREVILRMNGIDVRDIHCLKNVPKVSLFCCTNLTQLEDVENVKDLELSAFVPSSLNGLKRTECLRLIDCKNITTFKGLEMIKQLELDYLSYKMNLPDLQPTFDKLVIRFPRLFTPPKVEWEIQCNEEIRSAMKEISENLNGIEWLNSNYTFERSNCRWVFLKKT